MFLNEVQSYWNFLHCGIVVSIVRTGSFGGGGFTTGGSGCEAVETAGTSGLHFFSMLRTSPTDVMVRSRSISFVSSDSVSSVQWLSLKIFAYAVHCSSWRPTLSLRYAVHSGSDRSRSAILK